MITSGILILLIIIIIIAIILYRTRKIVKASSVLFNSIMALGALLMYAEVFLLNAYAPTEAMCIAAPYVGHVAFALAFAALFAKTYVTSKARASFTRTRSSSMHMHSCT
jgi:hypothetical protein